MVVDVEVRGPTAHGSQVAHVVTRRPQAPESGADLEPLHPEAEERVSIASGIRSNVLVGANVVVMTHPRSERNMSITPSPHMQQGAAAGNIWMNNVGPIAQENVTVASTVTAMPSVEVGAAVVVGAGGCRGTPRTAVGGGDLPWVGITAEES